eukprot:544876_1
MMLPFCFLIVLTNSSWISPSSSLLPVARTEMIVGLFNQTISLLGGTPSTTDLVAFNIQSNNFSITNISGLNESLDYGLEHMRSQYYTSADNIIYIAQSEYLSIYNMEIKTFTKQWQSLPVSTYSHLPCIASTSQYLFIMGGVNTGGYLQTLYLFNFSSGQWNKRLPIMTTTRDHFACIAIENEKVNKLYAIAGYIGHYLSSVECLEIDNIETNTWNEIGHLSWTVRSQRAVQYKDIIFIIGGLFYSASHSYYKDMVYIIDTNTDKISVSSDNLPYGASCVSAVISDDIIYAFGGFNNYFVNNWMYYTMPTNNPTQTPITSTPTSSPTTTIPTLSPTGTAWISPLTPLLPVARGGIIIGTINQSIKLLGGSHYNNEVITELITYDIAFNNFSITTLDGIIETLDYSSAQYYTSINNIIYIAQQEYLSIYNMETNIFTQQWISYPAYFFSYSVPCLAVTSNYLFLIGGYRNRIYLDEVKSINLATKIWNSNLPLLNTGRAYHGCIVSESSNKMYVMGGDDGSNMLSSIERIYISNIEDNSWNIIGDLTWAARGQRAVEYQQIIFIIGGDTYSGTSRTHYYLDLVSIIDTSNDEISTLSDNLVYGTYCTSAIVVDHTIYAFGGRRGPDSVDAWIDTWMYYEILTPSPTQLTVAPTSNPTTVHPTIATTQSPSKPNTTRILTPYCNDVIVEIINLNGISAYDFKASQQLQDFITNVTSEGIKQSADEYAINTQFITNFVSVSGEINITEAICTVTQNMLNVVNVIMEDQTDIIAQYIQNQTIQYFVGISGVLTDNMSVNIYWQSYGTKETDESELKIMAIPTLYITLSVFGLFLLITVIAILDAKLCHKNDYLYFMSIISVSFEVSDIMSDILFSVLLVYTYLYYKQLDILIATISSFLFIIIPVAFSIFQLIQQQKKSWFQYENLRGWLLDNSCKLLALSIITGSSYAAIELVNCGALRLEIFNMGLNKQQRIKYNTKRIIGVVLLENIPQTIIQIWYLIRFELHLTPILSCIFSLTSISLTILAKYTQKSILENSETVKVQFDVKGENVKPKLSGRTNGIKKRLAALFEVTQNLIDIPKPKLIHQGHRFIIYLFVQDANVKYAEFQLIMNEAINNEVLVNIFQTEWNLESELLIDNVKSEKVLNKSKQVDIPLMDVSHALTAISST